MPTDEQQAREAIAYQMGHDSRDAEVQALREALEAMVAVFLPRSTPGPDAHAETDAHRNAVLLLAALRQLVPSLLALKGGAE